MDIIKTKGNYRIVSEKKDSASPEWEAKVSLVAIGVATACLVALLVAKVLNLLSEKQIGDAFGAFLVMCVVAIVVIVLIIEFSKGCGAKVSLEKRHATEVNEEWWEKKSYREFVFSPIPEQNTKAMNRLVSEMEASMEARIRSEDTKKKKSKDCCVRYKDVLKGAGYGDKK